MMGQTWEKRCFVLKRTALIVSLWCISLPLLYLVCSINSPPHDNAPCSDIAPLPQNSFGPFAVSRFGLNQQCTFGLSFDRMSVSNGSAGLFKTALYQQLNVTDLKLQSFSYSPQAKRPALRPRWLRRATRTLKAFDPLAEALDLLSETARNQSETGAQFRASLPDCSRAAQLTISGFQWQDFKDRGCELTVKSHRAVLDIAGANKLTLKGHVILQTAEQTIEANNVVLDLKTRSFYIPGNYVLSVNCQKTYGRNACLNSRLEPIEPQQAALFTGENVCLANPSF